MRRVLLGLALTVTVVLAVTSLGIANSGSAGDPSGDLGDTPVGISSSSVDIVRASSGHGRGGRLVHKVSVAGNVPDPASGNAPMLFIEATDEPNGQADCAYFVGRHQGRFGVFTCGYGDRVGSLRMTRTSGSTVRFEFKASAIGNPPEYHWAALTRSRTRYSSSYFVDRLPSPDHTFITHRLR